MLSRETLTRIELRLDRIEELLDELSGTESETMVKKLETKKVTVVAPSLHWVSDQLSAIATALAPYEVDGWKADPKFTENTRRWRRTYMQHEHEQVRHARVTFTRYVYVRDDSVPRLAKAS